MDTMILLLIGMLVASVSCIPKYDDAGFKPSSLDYSEKSGKAQDQMAVSSHSKSRNDGDLSKNSNELNDRSQEPRFGFTNVADGTGYGVGSYAPVRPDLGGLLLGAVIGIGTILIIPKLLYVLSGSYGPYARSEDEGGVAQLMSRLDDALARNGIDTTACMQRLACSYAKQAAEATAKEEASSLERLVNAAASSQMLQGTAVHEALEAGRSGGNCARAYHQCSLSPDLALSMLAKLTAGAT
ncbi:hypothetical protein QAD02_005613 [Eretmocerus hayati]|uniref:Uncharacterized protein n=1 Tax=Eretmocerus hayati TaxID=131215 RepID=A0ACC2NUQ9_9HYME|nr:hypothetical protein QAD02_005613 [Eretmocerus hayati]